MGADLVEVPAGRPAGRSEFVEVPGGRYAVGEPGEERVVELPRVLIGRWPVTNAHYRRFLVLWGGCEPELRHVVREVERRLARLGAR